MNLRATFPQYKDGDPDKLIADINIDVDYDPEERVVTEVLSVWTYNYRLKAITDLSSFFDTFSKQLDEILETVDWWEHYIEARESKRQKVA